MNVLLVDDDHTIRRIVKLMLSSLKVHVLEAPDAAAAIAVFEENSIDLLVTDVVMGGMDGWTLAHRLAGRNPDLPVLFMSGYPLDYETARRQCSQCALLPKPFQRNDLINALAQLGLNLP